MDHVSRMFAICHEWSLRAAEDEAGLAVLAYALGAAVILVPIAVAMAFFGSDTANGAGASINGVLDFQGSACDTPALAHNKFC